MRKLSVNLINQCEQKSGQSDFPVTNPPATLRYSEAETLLQPMGTE